MFSTIPSGDTPVSNSSVWLALAEADPHQRREPGLGDQRVGHPGGGAHAADGPGQRAVQGPRPVHPPHGVLVDEQWVGHVVDEHRDLDAVDRFERDRASCVPRHPEAVAALGLELGELLAVDLAHARRRDRVGRLDLLDRRLVLSS